MKNIISEMKNALEEINSRLDEAEDQISDLEVKEAENIQSEQQKEKTIFLKMTIVSGTISNITTFTSEGYEEEREQGIEKLFEKIMTENFPNLLMKRGTQVQELLTVPNKRNPKRPTPKHIIIKMAKVKDKERIFKAARKRQIVTYKGTPIRLSAEFCFLNRNISGQKDWHKIFKVMKKKDLYTR